VREAPLRSYVRPFVPHVVGATLLSAVLFVFMFAPRGAGVEGLMFPPADPGSSVSLGSALTAPGEWPALVDATWSQFVDEYGAWAEGTGDLTLESYRTRIEGMLGAMFWAGGALTAFSLVGFARERYGVAEGRPLVMLLVFAAGASLVGYPLGLSIDSGYKWNVAHVLFPLAIPAAVGLGMAGRITLSTYLDEDVVGRVLLSVVVLAAVVVVAWQGAGIVYLNPQHESNTIVQGAQPTDDLRPLVKDLEAAAAASDGTDTLIYSNTSMRGSFVRSGNVSDTDGVFMNFRPVCTNWPETLPLDWYFASTGVEADCAQSTAELRFQVENNQPPVVVVRDGDDSVPHEWLTERYEATTYSLRFTDNTPPRTVVYVRSDIASR
jgi:predicted membrane-bound mannosyltransferase